MRIRKFATNSLFVDDIMIPNIIDLRKQKNSVVISGKRKAALKPAQKSISAPQIQTISAPAVFPAQKPIALSPEMGKTSFLGTPKALTKIEQTKPESKEYLAPIFEWSAEERVLDDAEQRGRNIVIVGGAALVTLAAFFIGNYLLAIFIALAAFVLYAGVKTKSCPVQCAITPQGVKIENRVYEFSDIKSFWIFYDPADIKELSLESKKTMMPRVTAPLGDADPVKLRETLLKFITEKKHEESLTDIIGRKFFG